MLLRRRPRCASRPLCVLRHLSALNFLPLTFAFLSASASLR